MKSGSICTSKLIKAIASALICLGCLSSLGTPPPETYCDEPFFGLLPGTTKAEFEKLFGPGLEGATLAGTFLMYQDKDGDSLMVALFLGETINELIICRRDAILRIVDTSDIRAAITKSLPQVKLPKTISTRGLSLGMKKTGVERRLERKLTLYEGGASVVWEAGGEPARGDYGSVSFVFSGERLVGISWAGVDP